MMTGTQVADRIRRTFGDESSVQVNDMDLVRWINDAQREIVNRGDILKQVATADITQGTNEYVLDGLPILKIQSLQVNGHPIDNKSFQSAEDYIIAEDPERKSTGQPILWYKWGNSIFFWPTPDKNAENGLRVYFVARPREIEQLNDELSLPDEYFNRIVEYVMACAYELDEDGSSHTMKLQQFSDNLTLLEGDPDRPVAEFYGTITVRPEDDWYY